MIAAYDTLSQYVSKPERPAFVAPKAYPDALVTEMLSLEQIISNVVRIYCISCII